MTLTAQYLNVPHPLPMDQALKRAASANQEELQHLWADAQSSAAETLRSLAGTDRFCL